MTSLYLPSTPLNTLLACAHALTHAETGAKNDVRLWLIDQKQLDNNEYFLALQQWTHSPFSEIRIFSGAAKGLSKLKERKKNFKAIFNALRSFQPSLVGVGSDRRVEFQYVMHRLTQQKTPAIGLYLDDGLYSYAGSESGWLESALNSFLKKMAYGMWWKEPKTVGASSIINQAWLFSPTVAIKAVKQARFVQAIPLEIFQSTEMTSLSALMLSKFDETTESYLNLDVLFFLPHPNDAKKMQDYQENIALVIQELAQRGKKVAIKYHPRIGQGDPFKLMALGVIKKIPARLASEFVLPILPSGCHVIGDVGTALLTCHWLRPDLPLTAVLSPEDPFQSKFIPIMRKMNVPMESNFLKVFWPNRSGHFNER